MAQNIHQNFNSFAKSDFADLYNISFRAFFSWTSWNHVNYIDFAEKRSTRKRTNERKVHELMIYFCVILDNSSFFITKNVSLNVKACAFHLTSICHRNWHIHRCQPLFYDIRLISGVFLCHERSCNRLWGEKSKEKSFLRDHE